MECMKYNKSLLFSFLICREPTESASYSANCSLGRGVKRLSGEPGGRAEFIF